MKKIPLFLFFIFAFISCSGHRINPDQPFSPKVPEEWEMPNGVRVLFLENRELPLVEGVLYIPGGGLWDKKLGTSAAMGSMMRGGGARNLSPQELDKKIKSLAAQISTSWGDEFGAVSFSSLSSTLDESLLLYADVLFRPRFDPNRFEVYKRQVIDSIRRRKDDPEAVAKYTLNSILFGGSAYGAIPVVNDVKSLTIDDLRSRYNELVIPDGAVFAITGDISKNELASKLKVLLDPWKSNGRTKNLTPPPVNSTPLKGIYFVNQPLKQATIMVGQRSLPRGHDDRFKIELFNSIYGFGGFGSRLTQEVRSKAGLSYVVYGGSVPGLVAGQNFIGLQTKNESAGLALKKSFEILNNIQAVPPSKAEIDESKESLMNSFIFRYETRSSTINRIATQMMLRVPRSFDEQYAREVPQVLPEGVSEVANRWWKADEMIVAVVGSKEALSSIKREGPNELRRLPVFEGKFDEVFSKLR